MNVRIDPQPGPQTAFLSTTANIAIYGGAAGGGKTYGLLLEPLRHFYNPEFSGVIFRRTMKQARNQGGLWDTGKKLYSILTQDFKETTLDIRFPSGMRVKFDHLEHENDVFNWQGAQLPFVGFDELSHFTEKQFFYMLTRLRSADAGVSGYCRATVNPVPDGWLREFVDWWIDDLGFAIPERSGMIRWFIKENEKIIWSDSREELLAGAKNPGDRYPLSVTFIPAKLEDNPILALNDPSYRAKIMAQDRVTRAQLLDGNWNVRPSAGMYFQESYFQVVDAVPANMETIRFWDRAATEGAGDWTTGVKLGRVAMPSGLYEYCVLDVIRVQYSAGKVEQLVLSTARTDGIQCQVGTFQDPGSAGKSDSENFVRMLSGFDVRLERITVDKVTAAKAISAQSEAGNVKVLRAKWNRDFFSELSNFPEASHDDQVDALSGAFNMLAASNVGAFTKAMVTPRVKSIAASLRGIDSQW